MPVLRLLVLAALFWALPFSASAEEAAPLGAITDEAQRIYQSYGDAVYQIQVIDLASEKKSSIGSGFQFSADGLMATNYHVVAEAIQRASNNRLEYLHDKGGKGVLTVLAADVVRDLAILRMDRPGARFVDLGASVLPKGAKIFSLGNPHDIGFTIIEGTYNGISEEGFTDKIHFSGSLNPGMSGGPALNHSGRVVGINVQTAGNQISFLVPVEHMKKLLATVKRNKGLGFVQNARQLINAQLLQSQESNISRLLAKKWDSVPFGGFAVPGRIDTAFKCWGAPAHEDKDPFRYFRSTCSSQDRIYLDDGFETGSILYRYDLLSAKEGLSLPRFYTLYEQEYSRPLEAFYNAEEGDATNFDCTSHFMDLADKRWKSSFCLRRYEKYPDIYDMHVYMALVGEGAKGLIISLVAQGVSRSNALKLTRKFLDEIKPEAGPKGGKTP